MTEIKERFLEIKREVKELALEAGRDPAEIKIVAVSKAQPLEYVKDLATEDEIIAFAESRVQDLKERADKLPELNWQMIGHLQRNKVKYLARRPQCNLIHSLDSYRLAKKINHRAELEDRVMDLLIQVNVAKDENKYGIMPEATVDFVKRVAEFDNIRIKGLMTILPHAENPEDLREYFKKMKQLFDQIAQLDLSGLAMEELSMGMSNDYRVAIKEGATILRLGRAIFGPRKI